MRFASRRNIQKYLLLISDCLPKSRLLDEPQSTRKVVKLTAEKIEAMSLPAAGKLDRLYDSTFPGLLVQISSGGKRTYFLSRKRFGQTVWLRIGTYPELLPRDARAIAADLLGRMERGEPVEDMQDQNHCVDSLFCHYFEQHCKPHTRSFEATEDYYTRYLLTNLRGDNRLV